MVGPAIESWDRHNNQFWCLNVDGGSTSSGAPMIMYQCTDTSNELFWTSITPQENVYFVIQWWSSATGTLCLTETRDTQCGPGLCYYYTATTCGTTQNPNTNQEFYLDPNGEICNVNTGRCVVYNSSTGGIEADSSGSGSNLHWSWWEAYAANGSNYFHPAGLSSCLEYNASTATVVYDSSCGGGQGDEWYFGAFHK